MVAAIISFLDNLRRIMKTFQTIVLVNIDCPLMHCDYKKYLEKGYKSYGKISVV